MATQWRICPKINCTLGISNCLTENPEFNSGFPVDFSWYFAAIFGYRMENHPVIKRGNGKCRINRGFHGIYKSWMFPYLPLPCVISG
jgi:hypothetical protein